MLKPCKTLNEFVEKYDKDLERILCKSFKKFFDIDLLDEVKNDVYTHLLEKKFFDTYDAERAQFSTYLYTYLFHFLKARKNKETKEPCTDAEWVDKPMYEDSNVTMIEVTDFKPSEDTLSHLTREDLDKKIQSILSSRLKKLEVHNPYELGSLEYLGWSIFESRNTVEQIEEYVSGFAHVQGNPYHQKKDSVKYDIWQKFSGGAKYILITEDNALWENVPGVKKHAPNVPNMNKRERTVYSFIADHKGQSIVEIISALGMKPRELERIIHKLETEGLIQCIVLKTGKRHFYIAHKKPFYTFDKAKNLSWHLIHYFTESHPEFFEFDSGCYFLNTKSNVTYRLYQMILNGKTNKEISNTYRVNSAALENTRNLIIRDIKKLMST
jgi:DNA-binding Lrp family transcriptional regulator